MKGAEVRVEKEKDGPPTGPPINMEISGPGIARGWASFGCTIIRKIISDIPGMVDLKDNFVSGKPEIIVEVDKEKAALLGLDTYLIAYTVKTAINGSEVGVYREGKEEYDIIVKLPEKDSNSIESLKRITISGPKGEPVPLTSVAKVHVAQWAGSYHQS
jgi:multidrug efflux pump